MGSNFMVICPQYFGIWVINMLYLIKDRSVDKGKLSVRMGRKTTDLVYTEVGLG